MAVLLSTHWDNFIGNSNVPSGSPQEFKLVPTTNNDTQRSSSCHPIGVLEKCTNQFKQTNSIHTGLIGFVSLTIQ